MFEVGDAWKSGRVRGMAGYAGSYVINTRYHVSTQLWQQAFEPIKAQGWLTITRYGNSISILALTIHRSHPGADGHRMAIRMGSLGALLTQKGEARGSFFTDAQGGQQE